MRRDTKTEAFSQRVAVLHAGIKAAEVLALTDPKSADAALRLALLSALHAPK